MIIFIVNIDKSTIDIYFPDNPVIGTYCYCPRIFSITPQAMKMQSWQIHFLRSVSSIQSLQNLPQPPDVPGIEA